MLSELDAVAGAGNLCKWNTKRNSEDCDIKAALTNVCPHFATNLVGGRDLANNGLVGGPFKTIFYCF